MTNPKCLGSSLPDTFSARSAHLTGLKMRRITRAASFDHLVGTREQRLRQGEAQRLCRCKIDDEIELYGLLDWQIAWIRSAQNLVDIIAGAPKQVRDARSIRHQTSRLYPLP